MGKQRILKSKFYNFIYSFLTPRQRIEKIINRPKYIKLNTNDYLYWNKEYEKWVTKLREKAYKHNKIQVGFIVFMTCSFSAENILHQMINDNIFEPSIIVVPSELVFSNKKSIQVYKDSLQYIKQKYKDKIRILEAYNEKSGQIIDYTKEFDIMFTPTNDERILPQPYKIYNFIKNKILCCYTSYAFYAACDDSILTDTYNLCWKVFTENELNYKDLEYRQPLKGKNAYISGYAKIDSFFGLKKENNKRKSIIIAPHHSIHECGLCSRFLQYADLFLRLPNMYPQIDFIFRPHPLLRNTLYSSNFWGEEKTNQYFENILSYSNVKYDSSSEYYQTFINSDGIIHDCGSFLPEYIFSSNPCCYMLKNKESINKYFNELGKECLNQYYQAYTEDDIINYIENVVLAGNDIKKNQRIFFLNEILKVNYPHVAETIVNYLKDKIK